MKHATLISVLGLAMAAGQVEAQLVRLDKYSPGYGTDVWFSRTYDTGSVMTFMAKVQQVNETGPTAKGGAVAISYVVRPYTRQDIGDGKVRDIFQAPVTVEVGPKWFVRDQSTKVKVGDYISVTGSRVDHDNGSIIVAEMIKRNKDVLGLRRPSGEPFWMVDIDANNAANNQGWDNPAQDAVKRTNAQIAAGQVNDPNQPLPPIRIGNVVNFGQPQAKVGNVLIYGWPWYYNQYYSNYVFPPAYYVGGNW